MATSRSNVISLSTGVALSAEEQARRDATAPPRRPPEPITPEDARQVLEGVLAVHDQLASALGEPYAAELARMRVELEVAWGVGDQASQLTSLARWGQRLNELRARMKQG
jgi:hypothetical protein